MYYVLGSYEVQLDRWDSIRELSRYLVRCNLGYFEMGDERAGGSVHYSLTVFQGDQRFGIGVHVDSRAMRPAVLLDLERRRLVLGYNQALAIIDVPSAQVTAEHDFGQRFHRLHALNHLGLRDFFLVQHELGVAAVAYEGSLLWDYQGHALVDNLEVGSETLTLHYLAAPRKVTLRLADGTAVEPKE